MKIQFCSVILSGFIASTSFADSFCMMRQQVEAHIAAAKLWNVRAEKVVFLLSEPGMWTEATAMNEGSDSFMFALSNKSDENGEPITKTIEVKAKQIGATEDCKILSAKEVK
jgi:hypothetical protein